MADNSTPNSQFNPKPTRSHASAAGRSVPLGAAWRRLGASGTAQCRPWTAGARPSQGARSSCGCPRCYSPGKWDGTGTTGATGERPPTNEGRVPKNDGCQHPAVAFPFLYPRWRKSAGTNGKAALEGCWLNFLGLGLRRS